MLVINNMSGSVAHNLSGFTLHRFEVKCEPEQVVTGDETNAF